MPAVLDMWIATWQAAYPDIDFAARRGWTEDRFAELAQTGSQSFVAEAGGKIVGLVMVNPATGYLDQFAVATRDAGPRHRRTDCWRRRAPDPAPRIARQQGQCAGDRVLQEAGFAVTGESTNPRSGAPIYLMRWEKLASFPAQTEQPG